MDCRTVFLNILQSSAAFIHFQLLLLNEAGYERAQGKNMNQHDIHLVLTRYPYFLRNVNYFISQKFTVAQQAIYSYELLLEMYR